MLAYLVIRFETFDTDALARELKTYDANGVIVVYNYGGEIKVEHCPPSIPLKSRYYFYRPGTWSANRWCKWSRLILIMSSLMLTVVRRQKVKHVLIGGGDILSWLAQILKKLGRVQRTTTLLEDWSLPNPMDSRFNRLKMDLNDFLLTHMDTRVIQTVKESFEIRDHYRLGKTRRNTILYEHIWAWFLERKKSLPVTPIRRSICFLGNARLDFGLEILFELLPELNRDYGFRLKMIGPETALYAHFRKLATQKGLDPWIDWAGFVPLEDLPQALEECFCGINLYVNENNVNRFVFAGRVIVYLQHLVVPVLSPFSGPTVKLIEDFNLGVVCLAEREAVKRSLLLAFQRNAEYVKNIDHFLANNPYRRSVKDLMEPSPLLTRPSSKP